MPLAQPLPLEVMAGCGVAERAVARRSLGGRSIDGPNRQRPTASGRALTKWLA